MFQCWSYFYLKLNFISFRCLVNTKLRQQQLVNCKIYENKNGLIFDEASTKRDLIVHVLFTVYGEQFILFLPFRAAPESCEAEPSRSRQGWCFFFLGALPHSSWQKAGSKPCGAGSQIPPSPADLLLGSNVGSVLQAEDVVWGVLLLSSYSFFIFPDSLYSSWGRPCSSTVWAVAALWDGNADGIVKCSQLLAAWLLTAQTSLLLGPRLLSQAFPGVLNQPECGGTVWDCPACELHCGLQHWRSFLRSGWTGGGILCCRWVEDKACWMTSE